VTTIPSRALEEVYAVPLAEFTRTRNARAAALAKAGDREGAAALKRLRRPAATLWAINQLGRRERKRLDAFIDAVAHLRQTQLRQPSAVGAAVQRQRASLDALLDAAREHLIEHGLNAGPGALGKISSTLQGAAVDPRLSDDLRHGRLTDELAPPGFEVFADAKPSRLHVLPGGKKAAGAAEAGRRNAERLARREEIRQRRAREAEERERAARERKAVAEKAAAEVETLASQLAEARRRLSEARRGAKRAGRKSRGS
jgi:hypothetical protein